MNRNIKPYNYKLKIFIIKESDEKAEEVSSVVNLTKDAINLMKKKSVNKSIHYEE